MQRLAIQAAVNTFTNPGQILCEVVAGLTALDWRISIKALRVDETIGDANAPVPLEIKDLIRAQPEEEWELTIAPLDVPQIPTPGKKAIYWTAVGREPLEPWQKRILNQCRAVIVPQGPMKLGLEYQIQVPVYVVPFGYNPTIFQPSPVSTVPPCIFGVVGLNGVERLVRAFDWAFEGSPDAELWLRIAPGEHYPSSPQIRVCNDLLPWVGVARWMQGITCLIDAKMDPWDTSSLQASACGRYPYYANSSTVGIASLMLNVAEKLERAAGDWQKPANWAQKFTWQKTIDTLETALSEIIQ